MQVPAQGRGRGGGAVGSGAWGPPYAGWGGVDGAPGGWVGGWWYCTGWGPLPQQMPPPPPLQNNNNNNINGGGNGGWGVGGGGAPPPLSSTNQISPPAVQQTPTPLNNSINHNNGVGGGAHSLPSPSQHAPPPQNNNYNINSSSGGGGVYGPPPLMTPPLPSQNNNSGRGPNTIDIGSYGWADKDNEIRVDPSAFNEHTGTVMIGNRTHAGRNNIVRIGAGVANQPQTSLQAPDNPGNRSTQGTTGFLGRLLHRN